MTRRLLVSVTADCLDRTAFHGLFTESPLFRGSGLLVDVGIPPVLVAGEVVGRGFTAEITIDALVIDIKLPDDVVLVSVFEICHAGFT